MRSLIVILAFLAFAAGLAPPARGLAADNASPEAFLQDFYRREQLPVKRSELRVLFAADLAQAMLKEYGKPEPGELDFDYRYGTQDWDVKEISYETLPVAGGAAVTARFESFGKGFEIRYRLAQLPGHWRILDVSAPAQNGDRAWSLREKLRLRPVPWK